jgi:P4 family phage/plasmid primase-like protien
MDTCFDKSKNYSHKEIKDLVNNSLYKFRDSHINNTIDDTLHHRINAIYSDTCSPGTWDMPDIIYEQILELIYSGIEKGGKLTYVEVPHIEYNQVKIDLDLKFEPTNEEKNNSNKLMRRYNEDFIENIISALVDVLSEVIDLKHSFKIYLQEKSKPKLKNGFIKDGIHVMIPQLVIENKYLLNIREKLLQNKDIIESLKKVNNCVEIENTIDKSIITSSGWFIYGCGKPDDKGDYYRTTHAWKVGKDWEIKVLSENTINKLNEFTFENVKLFSNFGKLLNTTILDSYVICDSTLASSNPSFSDDYINKSIIELDTRVKRRQSDLKPEEIKSLLNCIKRNRVDDFHDWRKIGLALFNMDTRNFMIWDEWSRGSNKYDKNFCAKIWNNEFPTFSKYEIGLSNVKELAKLDSPNIYNKINNENKRRFLTKWVFVHENDKHSGKSTDLITFTQMLKEYIKDYAQFRIVCVDPSSTGTWYKYDNHLWKENKKANAVFMLLSNDLRNDFNELKSSLENELRSDTNTNSNNDTNDSYSLYDDRINNSEVISNFNSEYQVAKLNQRIKQIEKLIKFLSGQANRNNIITELSHNVYDEEFYENLDENKDIFICKNGVLDLKTCEFRPGKPSDMGTMSAGIDFPLDIENNEASTYFIEIQEYLNKIFIDQDLQEYFLNLCAECLTGQNTKEEFYIMTGSGSNGKSQILKFIDNTLGKYYYSFDNALLLNSNDNANNASPVVAGLKGKRFAITSEPDNKKPIKTDKVKELCGGDNLTGRHLHKDSIMFSPQYKLFMACNDIPDMPSTDDGIWRRVRCIPFASKFILNKADLYKLKDPVKYPNHFKADNNLEKKYKLWAPYFLYMLFDRFKKIKENSFVYDIPDNVKEATNKYKAESNIYEQFFNEKIKEKPGYCISKQSAFKEFKNFVTDNNAEIKPTNRDFFKNIARFIGEPNKFTKKFNNFIIGDIGDKMDD